MGRMLTAYNKAAGIFPGGMYAGIMQIPGDVNGEWLKGDQDSITPTCPACERGKLFQYWQDMYYKTKCDVCGYLHDTGMKLTPEEIEAQEIMIAEVCESERLMFGP